MKNYEQPKMVTEYFVLDDAILASSFGQTEKQAGDIDVDLF